ncbi:PilN domain-containing protein [Budviciaceae bacterium BWR-B9]|uniref:PilN domain-containing protein n=1 Tax=Limnobaculum allomyrinae TaxID=2791986 RepID=A0ABS1IQM8_9GAMM|nr:MULTISPECIES: PilN domain-containing protein [Limnobaculum]MBK5144068.1 PilN domain-containing protein [Limnobaculum allomyrinae]MBV7691727.1 PilN domain-containing protein [Limnobaculum sp. M2-1]
MFQVNFLPWRVQRQKKASQRFVGMAFCYAIATLLCLSASYFTASSQQQKLSQQLTEITASNTARLNEIKQTKDMQQAALVLTQLQHQTQQIRQHTLLLHTLFIDIESALPESLWLKRIMFKEEKLEIEGQGNDYLSIMAFQQKLGRSSLITGLQLGKMMAVNAEFSLFSFTLMANRTGVTL